MFMPRWRGSANNSLPRFTVQGRCIAKSCTRQPRLWTFEITCLGFLFMDTGGPYAESCSSLVLVCSQNVYSPCTSILELISSPSACSIDITLISHLPLWSDFFGAALHQALRELSLCCQGFCTIYKQYIEGKKNQETTTINIGEVNLS